MKNETIRVIYAKANTHDAIADARLQAAAITRHGLLGPIDPPMICIPPAPGAARAVQKQLHQYRQTYGLEFWRRRFGLL